MSGHTKRGRARTLRRSAVVAATAVTLAIGGSAGAAEAALLDDSVDLIDSTVDTTTGVVGGVAAVLSPGWDDSTATTTGTMPAPASLGLVADAINADTVWSKGVDGSGVGVAVIDTGMVPVDGLNGPGKVVNGPDLSFDSQFDAARYLDGYGHGTHMAGIIAGKDVSGPFRGIAPGAHLVNVRVGASEGAVDVSQVIAAIDWVVEHRNDPGMNIRVLNLSYGTDGIQAANVDPLAHAVEVAWRHGIVVVVGGGNDGTSRPSLATPATDPYVLSVGAVDLRGTASWTDDVVAPFSSRGSSSRYVDLVAPGVSIASLRNPGSVIDVEHPSAVVDGRFFRGSGTSQAAAVVSGAAALLVQARPSLKPDQVKALLKSTATPLLDAGARAQGSGRVDVYRAVNGLVPLGSTQRWTVSTGTGSLEASRGTAHVADDGVELVGEQDIFGQAWNGTAWAASAEAETAWSGGSWRGTAWTGDCWCALTWSGTGWSGRTWIGNSWTGRTWLGRTWIGRTWIGNSWTGNSWTGRTWIGNSWTGRTWLAA